MINFWQDFDENYKAGWGLWCASYSVEGHIVSIVCGFKTKEEAISVLEILK